jgi:hypothetical protein
MRADRSGRSQQHPRYWRGRRDGRSVGDVVLEHGVLWHVVIERIVVWHIVIERIVVL